MVICFQLLKFDRRIDIISWSSKEKKVEEVSTAISVWRLECSLYQPQKYAVLHFIHAAT